MKTALAYAVLYLVWGALCALIIVGLTYGS